MRTINCRFIPIEKMRYPTAGDYWETKRTIEFRVCKMSDWRHEILVLFHELVEYSLVKIAGIDIEVIDNFDINFEEERIKGKHSGEEEPGDDMSAPYFGQHQVATMLERFLAFFLGVNWSDYDSGITIILNKKHK
jgi:hypothetical protein